MRSRSGGGDGENGRIGDEGEKGAPVASSSSGVGEGNGKFPRVEDMGATGTISGVI